MGYRQSFLFVWLPYAGNKDTCSLRREGSATGGCVENNRERGGEGGGGG